MPKAPAKHYIVTAIKSETSSPLGLTKAKAIWQPTHMLKFNIQKGHQKNNLYLQEALEGEDT